MTVKNILDSIYVIPVILDHLEKPTPLTNKILREKGITGVQLSNLAEIKDLLRYHHGIIMTDFNVNGNLYPLLRKGLKQYFEVYLSDFFAKSDTPNQRVLDYGSGDGQIATLLRELNPTWSVYTLDRHGKADLNIDFEKTPEWYLKHISKFNIVIMSELLHCKNIEWQQYLLRSAHAVLAPAGRLFVIENEDYCMAYRISKLKQQEVTVITEDHLKELCDADKGFKMTDHVKKMNHVLYELRKI